MRAKISKRLVDQVTVSDKPIFIFDTALAGFVLKITPAGRRTYQLRYRMGGRGTPLRTYTMGTHGQLSPDQARRLAESLIGDVRRGIDPAVQKAKQKAYERSGLTVEVLSAEFLEVYGKAKLKPRSFVEYERAFKSHINPRIGRLKVRDVRHADVERLHHAMRTTPPTANRTIAALSKFFSWAIRSGHRPDRQNPCTGLEKYKEQARERYLSSAKIAAVGRGIRMCEQVRDITPWQAALLRLLLLTGLRRDELRTLEWRNVDFDRGVILLEDTKTGRRDVPISGQVVKALRGVPTLDGNPFVFCGSKRGQPIVNIAKPWKRVMEAARIAPARLHDLRHTVASVGVLAGASLLLIGGVLGHRNERTTKRYAHLSDDPVRATSEVIGDRIAKALDADHV